MNTLQGDVWMRRGISFLWGAEALARLARPQEVLTIRQFFALLGHWPVDLPSNGGNTLVVAGLEGCIDLLTPEDAENWLSGDVKSAMLSFQDEYQGQAALVFWLPSGARRIKIKPASEEVVWLCGPPFPKYEIELGRVIWGGATNNAEQIEDESPGKFSGLYHPRLT